MGLRGRCFPPRPTHRCLLRLHPSLHGTVQAARRGAGVCGHHECGSLPFGAAGATALRLTRSRPARVSSSRRLSMLAYSMASSRVTALWRKARCTACDLCRSALRTMPCNCFNPHKGATNCCVAAMPAMLTAPKAACITSRQHRWMQCTRVPVATSTADSRQCRSSAAARSPGPSSDDSSLTEPDRPSTSGRQYRHEAASSHPVVSTHWWPLAFLPLPFFWAVLFVLSPFAQAGLSAACLQGATVIAAAAFESLAPGGTAAGGLWTAVAARTAGGLLAGGDAAAQVHQALQVSWLGIMPVLRMGELRRTRTPCGSAGKPVMGQHHLGTATGSPHRHPTQEAAAGPVAACAVRVLLPPLCQLGMAAADACNAGEAGGRAGGLWRAASTAITASQEC
jgi:hypothetical protein